MKNLFISLKNLSLHNNLLQVINVHRLLFSPLNQLLPNPNHNVFRPHKVNNRAVLRINNNQLALVRLVRVKHSVSRLLPQV
jgi:hypothetical protein